MTSARCAIRCAAIRAGLLAGAAMMPFGISLRAFGHPVNVYGELVVRSVLGSAPIMAMLVLHAAVSIALAVPFVSFAPRRRLVLHGAAYGAASWAIVNATILPLWFGRPTAWALGLSAVWPSLLVHIVYGVVLGVATARRECGLKRATS